MYTICFYTTQFAIFSIWTSLPTTGGDILGVQGWHQGERVGAGDAAVLSMAEAQACIPSSLGLPVPSEDDIRTKDIATQYVLPKGEVLSDIKEYSCTFAPTQLLPVTTMAACKGLCIVSSTAG